MRLAYCLPDFILLQFFCLNRESFDQFRRLRMKRKGWLAGLLALSLVMTSTGGCIYAGDVENNADELTDVELVQNEESSEETDITGTPDDSIFEIPYEADDQESSMDDILIEDELFASDDVNGEDALFWVSPDDPEEPEEPDGMVLFAASDDEDGSEGDGSEGDDSEGEEEEEEINAIPIEVGPTEFSFEEEQEEVWFSLQFDPDGDHKLRYKLQTDSQDMRICCRYEDREDRRESYGMGSLYVNDIPGSNHLICVSRGEDENGTLTVTRMPEVTSIEPAVASLPLEGGLEMFVFDGYCASVHYEDNSYDEVLPIDSFGEWVHGEFCEDVSCLQPIEDMRTYSGIAYTKVIYEEEEDWSFVASFDVTPFNADAYPMIYPDDQSYKVEVSGTGGDPVTSKLYRIQVDDSGVYEFVGQNTWIAVLLAEMRGGDYWQDRNLGVYHAYLQAGREYFVRVNVQRDDEDCLPDSGTFRCHKAPVLRSVDIGVPQVETLTWKDVSGITKDITYEDPVTGQTETFSASLWNPVPSHNGYYFDGIGSEMWKEDANLYYVRLYSAYKIGSYDMIGGEEGYSPIDYERYIPISSVYIADGTGVSAGVNADETVNNALDAVWNGDESAVISPETRELFEAAMDSEAILSATLEINEATDQAAQELVFEAIDSDYHESIVQSLDMQVVLRSNDEVLGNILKMPQSVDLGVTVSNYDPDRYYYIFQVCNGEINKRNVYRTDADGTDAVLWFRSDRSAVCAIVVSDDAPVQPQGDLAVPLEFGSEWSLSYNLIFDDTGDGHMLRYRLETSDPDMDIQYEHSWGGGVVTGKVTFNDYPGTEHRITIGRTSETQTSAILYITKLPEIVSIEALNIPDLVAHTEMSAFDKVRIKVNYADGSYEELLRSEFGINHTTGEYFHTNAELTDPIYDLENYTGPAYVRMYLCGEPNWAFTASFNVSPYHESDYQTVEPDDTVYQVGPLDDPSAGQWFRIINVPETALYEFVGQNVEIGITGSGAGWGGYGDGSLGVGHTILEAGKEYMLLVKIREDDQGNIPATGSFWGHKEIPIDSIRMEVDEHQRLDWANWDQFINKVITYTDPADGLSHEVTMPLFDGNELVAERHLFETEVKVAETADPNIWTVTVIQAYGRDNEGRSAEDSGYDPVFCSENLTIYNVRIAPALSSLVVIGLNTSQTLNNSLGNVLNNGTGAGTAVSPETRQGIEDAQQAEKPVTANLEINEGTNAEDKQLVKDYSGVSDEDIFQVIDAQVVVRGGNEVLGTIDELTDEVVMSVKVDDYDPDMTYSVYRVHEGTVKELDSQIVTNGSETELQFGSDKFSTFVLAKEGVEEYTVTIDADSGCTVTAFIEDTVSDPENPSSSGNEGRVAVKSGDRVPAGTILQVDARAKTGYRFTENGQPDATYTVNGDVTITARTEKRTYAVTLDAVNGQASSNQADLTSVPYGTRVTVTAGEAVSGYVYTGWYQTNGKRITEEESYTFTVIANTRLKAGFEKTGNRVTFIANDQIRKVLSDVSEVSSDDFPADPSPYYGYEFDGWDKTAEEINAALANGDVTVTAQFKVAEASFTVTIYNGESDTPTTQTYTENKWISVEAKDVEGKNLAYWKLDDEILSYSGTACFRTDKDCILTAVYTSGDVEPVGTAVIRSAAYNSSTRKLVFVAYLTVPEGARITGSGLVSASETSSKYSSGEELTFENADYVKNSAKAMGTGGPVTYTWTKGNVETGDTWYARPYVSYTLDSDPNGDPETVYGEMVTVQAGYDYSN